MTPVMHLCSESPSSLPKDIFRGLPSGEPQDTPFWCSQAPGTHPQDQPQGPIPLVETPTASDIYKDCPAQCDPEADTPGGGGPPGHWLPPANPTQVSRASCPRLSIPTTFHSTSVSFQVHPISPDLSRHILTMPPQGLSLGPALRMSYEASTTPPEGWRGWTFSPQGILSPLSLLCPYPQPPRPLLEAGPFAFMPSSPAQLMSGPLASSPDTSSQCSNKISLSCQSLSTFMLGPRDHSFIHSFKQSMLTELHSQALSLPESSCVSLWFWFLFVHLMCFSL